jgi:hypothetical protein
MTTPTVSTGTPTIPLVSRDYLYFPDVKAFAADSPDGADPTSLPVLMAFIFGSDDPADDDFHVGEWLPFDTEDEVAMARYLLDPTELGLTKGTYNVWLRITGAVEEPTHKVGKVKVS